MRRSALLLPFALALATAAGAALPEGAKAPGFSAPAAQGGDRFTFTLAEALRKGPVVLYFFPAAFTPGCTVEAHEFAAAMPEFKKLGATVIGMSADPIDKLADFSTKECSSAFPVGSASPAIVSAFDVPLKMKAGLTDRTSYVIDRSGKIVFVHSDLKPAGHVTGTLDAVKQLAKK